MKRAFFITFLVALTLLSYAQAVKYRVDSRKCITCGYCVQSKVCPVNAIHIIRGKAVIDRETCIGCKLCQIGNQINYKGCPVSAFGPESSSTKKLTNSKQQNQSSISTNQSNLKVVIQNGVKTKTQGIKKTNGTDSEKTNAVGKSDRGNSKSTNVTKAEVVKVLIYKVEPATCIGCQLCVTHCPVNAIDFIDNKAIIDQSKCIHCGICKNGNKDDFAGCPVGAISATQSRK